MVLMAFAGTKNKGWFAQKTRDHQCGTV